MLSYRLICVCLGLAILAGCSGLSEFGAGKKPAFAASDPSDYKLRPMPRGGRGGIAPPQNAETVEEFDTTTNSERIAAAVVPVAAERLIGVTVASLGSPAETGFWAKTPLVSVQTQGRLVDPASGNSVQVTLTPIEGPKTGGSRVSLAAMRVLGVSLTGLPTLEVWIGG